MLTSKSSGVFSNIIFMYSHYILILEANNLNFFIVFDKKCDIISIVAKIIG